MLWTRRERVRSEVPCVALHARHVAAQVTGKAKSFSRLVERGCPSGKAWGQAFGGWPGCWRGTGLGGSAVSCAADSDATA